MVILVKDESMLCYLCPLTVALACKVVTMWAFDMISHKFKHAAISVLHSNILVQKWQTIRVKMIFFLLNTFWVHVQPVDFEFLHERQAFDWLLGSKSVISTKCWHLPLWIFLPKEPIFFSFSQRGCDASVVTFMCGDHHNKIDCKGWQDFQW